MVSSDIHLTQWYVRRATAIICGLWHMLTGSKQVSKLRRLIADHADLHNNDLPPNYLFSATDHQSSDDLTQLVVMLAGPHGTPYSAGLWRLQLRIPEDYPASPPKAAFRTRIWHPNVEESTGAVCVDTLKRDWEPKLTLRDILVVCFFLQKDRACSEQG